MTAHVWQVPAGVRAEIASAVRDHDLGLGDETAKALAADAGLDHEAWRDVASRTLSLLASAVETGRLAPGRPAPHQWNELLRFAPRASLRQILRAVHATERSVLQDLAGHETLGARSPLWPMVGEAVRGAAFEVAAACAERGARPTVRDPLTTLLSAQIFLVALEQEIARAERHEHGLSVLLFDVDDISGLNASLGFGAGDRLLERLGILARSFFRVHDWIARHGDDSIAVLLPQTTPDRAAALATRFREMVQQRIVLGDHKTGQERTVTVSAAVAGTDRMPSQVEASELLEALETAVQGVKASGGNRTARADVPRFA